MENENPVAVSADNTEAAAPKRKRAPRRASSATKAEAASVESTESAPAATESASVESAAGAEAPAEVARASRGRGRGRGRGKTAETATEAASEGTEQSDASGDNGDSAEPAAEGQESGRPRRERNRRSRGRGRDEDFDGEISDDDVLIPVAGILDILDNYAFVRTGGYLASPADVYVALGQVKKYNLRKGDAIVGAIRQPQGGDFQNRQKYNALATVDFINGANPEAALTREDFADFTPVYATESLGLAGAFSGVKRGERVLVDAAPGSARTSALISLVDEVSAASPELHLMVVVSEGQPEDVTALTRTVRGEVSASTYDRHADEHITVADLAIARAKRLVEQGIHVVVILDSLTRVAKAQLSVIQGSRPLSEGSVDTAVFAATKRIFGAGRSFETGGSLTIIATTDNTTSGFAGAVRDELVDIATSVIAL